MPLTYIDIEKQKTWRIGIFFLLLLFLYFCVTFALAQGFLMLILPIPFIKTGTLLLFTNPLYLLIIACFSSLTALIHFWFSASDAVKSVINNLGAVMPDREDIIHKRLINIMDEIQIATGNKKKIECMVIPTLSVNALAAEDLKGNAVIALTEGLLSRLNRSQTEAVLAHEAYHILSGDCRDATVATSLFGMHAATLDKLKNFGEGDRSVLHPAFFFFWLLLKFSLMLSMFISREREYRADAASVRMTRNPLAMAEALHLISKHWRGSQFIGSGLEMLCIINPVDTKRDEREGFWDNLMSTHPPIRKRIDVLLKMVRVNLEELDRKMYKQMEIKQAKSEIGSKFYAMNAGNQWEGPFNPAELLLLPWFSPSTWVKADNIEQVERASENPSIQALLAKHYNQTSDEHSNLRCPRCHLPLLLTSYQKTKIQRCKYCNGVLVDNVKIPRVLVRKEHECSDRIESLARALIADNQRKLSLQMLKGGISEKAPLTPCPKCGNPMTRAFYSLAYLIETDRCGVCNITWFDENELEMLKCLIENKITAQLN